MLGRELIDEQGQDRDKTLPPLTRIDPSDAQLDLVQNDTDQDYRDIESNTTC